MEKRSSTARRKTKKKLMRGKIDELILNGSRLKFSSEQLQNLNFIFHKRLNDEKIADDKTSSIILARSVTERLIQRLVCGVGVTDPNFASKFLIHLHDKAEVTTSLQYLVRLDTLSVPTLYKNEIDPKYSIIENDPDFPKGYARIRMFAALYKLWGGYANSHGYLRRDKIQTRYVELLATVAASDIPNSPSNLDESIVCGSPGKVVDACTLHNILKTPSEEHVYFGANGNSPRFPDPRDFRLAIVDEPDGIRLRIEFLSPALSSICMDVRLLVGIEVNSWPVSTDFPTRIPLGHTDALLYQNAAHTGVYMVGYGVQSSAWQMRFPSAEDTIIKNYSPNSTTRNILRITSQILEEIYEESARHQKYQYCYKILNSYVFKTALFFELEEDFSGPTSILLNWAPHMLSTHVLKILDKLVTSLRNQKFPNYFFPAANLLANPGHLCEDDYVYESKRVLSSIVQLYHLSLTNIDADIDFERMLVGQNLEVMLLKKWKELIDGLLPPASTRGRRICFASAKSRREVAYTQYTGRQLQYIALLLKNALNVRNNILQPLDETWNDYIPQKLLSDQNSATEDVVYILLTIIEQARDHYLKNNNDKKMKLKLATHFDPTILKLVELVRKDSETILDDIDFVKVILKWLYRALDQNKRLLAPILRPYLNILFVSSHGNSWFLESILKRQSSEEVRSLGAFARLVNSTSITPAEGLVDCVNKNWVWAKQILSLLGRERLRVIFIANRGRTARHILSVPENVGSDDSIKEDMKFATLPKKSYFCTLLSGDSNDWKIPWHCILRDESCLTRLHQYVHRNGDHRCSGDIVQTLMSMQKLNILHDISTILPPDDRMQLLEHLQKLAMEKKKSTIRKRAQTLPNCNKLSSQYALDAYQKYTPKEETAGVTPERALRKSSLVLNKLDVNNGTLIGSCRTARIRDDSSFKYDNGSIRTMIRSKESFRN